ncbi:MAG: hypothetical protein EXR71_15360 [Myxococcales bacterium]|nr:hypothetical protein [Myxococcales bacterium]
MASEDDDNCDVMEDRRWRRGGWTAQVLKNEDDDGWAVSMTCAGQQEPALVGPWTMGRDKKNPKPLDAGAFGVLVKTVTEVIRRHEHAAHARLHRALTYLRDDGLRVRAELDITPDEYDAYAVLRCVDDLTGEELWTGRVSPSLRLSAATVDGLLAR